MPNRRDILIAALAGASIAKYPCAWAASVYPLKATRGGRLLLTVLVNGHPVEALLDSAAEASFLHRDLAREIGVISAEAVTAKGSGDKNFSVPLAKGVTLNAAGLTLKDQTIAVSDLSDVGR